MMSLGDIISESIAYLGMMLILCAFILETRDYVDSKNWLYLIMMALGSGLLAIRAFIVSEWAFLILEVVWCLAAAIALVSIKQKMHLNESTSS